MDLLQGAASRITSTYRLALSYIAIILISCSQDANSNRRRKPGQDAARFKTDDDTGKMIIDDNNTSGDDAGPSTDVAGTAYRESMTSVDGFTRGPNGRIKFNKDTKKRRREADEAEDVEMAEVAPTDAKKIKRKVETKIGHEFKAKVSFILLFSALSLTLRLFSRKPEATSQKKGLTPTHICRYRKPRRREDAEDEVISVSQGKGDLSRIFIYIPCYICH